MTIIDDLPLPAAELQERSHALSNTIRQRLKAAGGLLSFADFMAMALYTPQLGYYQAENFTIGRQGDFITAPEMSPLFAQCFARQCQQIFEAMGQGDVLELGAGTGRFAKELLLALEKQGGLPQYYYIYDVSLALRRQQQAFLQQQVPHLFNRFVWLDELPASFTGIIVANEVLDALPTHCFHFEPGAIQERCVAFENGNFVWQLAKPLSPALTAEVEKINSRCHFIPGYQSEINLQVDAFIQALAATLKQGVMLFCDYGYGERELYRHERFRGTLSCYYQHLQHDNPFLWPGLQDMTAFVDFTRVAESGLMHGLQLKGYTSQAGFLLACDLTTLVAEEEKRLSAVPLFEMKQAVKKLTLPMEMGERVKVMAFEKNVELPDLMGFRLQDRRHEL